MSIAEKFLKIYNPANETPEDLIAQFVVRTKEFNTIFEDLKSSTMKDHEQDYLIIGNRGMGKTTLLYRIKYAVQQESSLAEWLIPVSFPEEHYGISDLADFWEKTAEYLARENEQFSDLPNIISEISAGKNRHKAIFDAIISALKEKEKKIILLIDNLEDLLNKFETIEVKKFREELMTCTHLRMVAANPTAIEEVHDYKHPLYEFFHEMRLKGLDRKECLALIRNLAEITGKTEAIEKAIAEQPGKIETLRNLTGGVIRTIVLMFEVLTDLESGNSFLSLEALLERTTPLYKARMDELKPQQQKIVDAVARAFDPVTTKEIADKTKLASNLVSAQLKQLVDSQVIGVKKTDGKNNLYFLRERFFNIWYLMRHSGVRGKEKVKWLTRFMEAWYGKEEFNEKAVKFMMNPDQKNLSPEYILNITEAFAQSDFMDYNIREMLLSESKDLLMEDDTPYGNYLTKSDFEIRKGVLDAINRNDWKSFEVEVNKFSNNYQAWAILVMFELMLQNFSKAEEGFSILESDNCPGLISAMACRDVQFSLRSRKKLKNINTEDESFLARHIASLEEKIRREGAFVIYHHLEIIFSDHDDKVEALNFISKLDLDQVSDDLSSLGISDKPSIEAEIIKIHLWNNDFPKVLELLKPIHFENDEFLNDFLPLLIAKKQYHTALNLFKAHDLKDRFKPIWYALMHFMKDEFPNEFLKVTPEIEDIVQSVIARINQMEVDYA